MIIFDLNLTNSGEIRILLKSDEIDMFCIKDHYKNFYSNLFVAPLPEKEIIGGAYFCLARI